MTEMSQKDLRAKIIDTLLLLTTHHAWHKITLSMIAEQTPCSLSQMYRVFPSKEAIIGAYYKQIDETVLQEHGDLAFSDPAFSFKDRLGEAWLRRLDAMAPHKTALKSVTKALSCDFLSLSALNRQALNSMRYMVAMSSSHRNAVDEREDEIPSSLVALQGLVFVWTRVLLCWLDDDDAMTKTLAVLDKELTRALDVFNRLQRFRRWNFAG